MADKKNFIADATKNAHGQFSAKAKAAGMSTEEYARKEEHAPGKLGKQARLAETLEKVRPHKRKSSKEIRTKLYGKDK